ncbi:MAG: flavodoxin domain-containing protein [Bacillota bacterium]|nr:flavodoxin domain-containing protein [Bacillota bacterium]
MNIGLIIYSQTGNTRSVAEKLKDKLSSSGHSAVIDEIVISGNSPAQPGKFELKTVPDPGSYDSVIFGSPVQAFSLNPVMKAYMEKLPVLTGKKVGIFVTKQLPLLQAGGTGAIAHMKKACEAKGANVVGTEIVVWSEKKRDKTLKQCVENLSKLF